MQADGKILAGGDFTSIGGQPRNLFARLSNDTAALQNLAVTQTTVTWTRGGSSPQFTRVTFESSTDNVNYTPLGQRHGIRQQLDPVRFELADRTELLHPRSWLLSQRLQQRLGEHHGIRPECFYRRRPYTYAGRSRKLHSGAPFDINLPLTGTSGIECRSGGATNDYQVVFTFPECRHFQQRRSSRGTADRSVAPAAAARPRSPLISLV